MVMDFMEHQRTLEAKATELLREYEGKNLEEVGKALVDKNSYNNNYYMLPNGLEVVEKFDEFYEMGDIFGLIDGQAVLIGHTLSDQIIHLGVVC
jgi:hypothetical protein